MSSFLESGFGDFWFSRMRYQFGALSAHFKIRTVSPYSTQIIVFAKKFKAMLTRDVPLFRNASIYFLQALWQAL
jgi:hypothetical protein